MTYLIEHKANVNAVDNSRNTPLHKVVESRSIKDANKQYAIAELLIKKDADVNAKNADNKSPIDLASNNKSNSSMVTID